MNEIFALVTICALEGMALLLLRKLLHDWRDAENGRLWPVILMLCVMGLVVPIGVSLAFRAYIVLIVYGSLVALCTLIVVTGAIELGLMTTGIHDATDTE